MLTAQKLRVDQQDTAAGSRGYLLTGKQEFLDQYRQAHDLVSADIDLLSALTADNPAQQARMGTLRALSLQRLQHLDQVLREAQPGSVALSAAQIAEVESSKHVMDRIHALIDAVVKEEQHLLAERSAQADQSRDWVLRIILAGNVLSLGALLLSLLLLTRQIRDRRAAEEHVRALNETLAQRARLLELANNELEGFSYSISHDLRSPLRAIDGFSQLLEQGYQTVLDAEGMRLLGVVRDSSKRMGALIEDLLAFSRLGRKPLEGALTAMEPLVQECVAEIVAAAGAAPEPEIVIGYLPPCWGDRALLKQVWLNLIGNAVKYSSRNPKPHIEISAQPAGGECVYTVRDNGVGFDMQYYDKLFGVFQRLHRMDEFSGTGVGLAIVMRIVTKHGGRIWAEAALNEGAAFHFSIPTKERGS
jgi:signal transduction histidine kinase